MFRRLITALGALVVLALVVGGVYFIWFDRTTPDATPRSAGPTGRISPRSSAAAISPTAADCAACHNAPGGAPFAGGRPIETPFGIILAPNITPDPETGIGAWSDADFDAAVRQGKRRDGTLLYPAMPFPILRENVARRRARDSRLSQNGRARAQRGRRRPAAFPVQHPRLDAGLGRALFQAGRVQARRREIGGVESRRLSRRGPGPLRRLPYAEDLARRRRDIAGVAGLRRFRAGSRPTSPTTPDAASAAGASTISSPI